MTAPVSRLVCAGCGAEPDPGEPFPFRCPHAGEGDVDHVLRRRLDLSAVRFPTGAGEPNPFLRYRELLHAAHLGLADDELCTVVDGLDRQVAAVDGHGFRVTPFVRSDELSDRLGFSAAGGVWVKDETGNVSGSHKARHLFGVLVYLEVAERLGIADRRRRPGLAIASCGNAALAAAVVAAAGGRALHVFVPPDADPVVLARLAELGAHVVACPRNGGAGDPSYRRLLRALDEGAVPFTCQGNLNGLAVEGGQTIGWEIAASGVSLDRLVVQVGGGALASACIHAFREAAALGVIPASPRIDTVQTEGAWPLKRAYDAVSERGDLGYARTHRSEFMWPWEREPHSIARGILDDETYDWLAVVEGMLATGGRPLVVGEETLAAANRLGREVTGIDVDPTGSAGLAGLLALRDAGDIRPGERVAVLFTGVVRTDQTEERSRDEKLSRTRHPVAQGLRAG
ncbi:MAG TPA: pyridoxal-phosphate dependent enzyme [Gaiellaceae bacterium]|nr:pyridoxal-phosphate dependent enzyme [Gaiellaceae bacterium]